MHILELQPGTWYRYRGHKNQYFQFIAGALGGITANYLDDTEFLASYHISNPSHWEDCVEEYPVELEAYIPIEHKKFSYEIF